MKAKLVALIVIFVTNFRVCQSKRYDNYTLFSVVPVEMDHISFLQHLEKQKYIDVVFWTQPVKLHRKVQLIVNPNDRDQFMERARHFGVRFSVMNTNIQSAFDKQIIKQYLRSRLETFEWDYYHTLADTYQWLSDLAKNFPTIVELHSIGKSAEGRDIFVLGVQRGSEPKDKVIIEGGIHGNEWISTEFVTYLARQLVYSNESVREFRNLAHNYQWYLIPVVNPDGHDYSMKVDRMWRKNRRITDGGFGVDLNRNFDYNFGAYAVSSDVKDDLFCGPLPFSEPETKALSQFIHKKQGRLKFYFAFHGYGQKVIIPYSDRINHVDDYSEMENYGKQAVMEIFSVYGTKYSVGTFYDTLGMRISGNSASWVKRKYKVKYVFTIMLRDDGTYGFALPPDQILPTCKETLAGLTQIMTAKPRRLKSDLFGSASTSGVCKWLLGVILLITK